MRVKRAHTGTCNNINSSAGKVRNGHHQTRDSGIGLRTPLLVIVILLFILQRIKTFQLTELEKEQIMHDLSHTDAPRELVNTVDEVLEATTSSTNHYRVHFIRTMEYYYSDDRGRKTVLTLFYYKDKRLKRLSCCNTTRTTRWIANFERDGFLSCMRVKRKRPRICPRQ